MGPSLAPYRHANFALKAPSDGPFIYSALSARKKKQAEIPWVLGDPAEIAMVIHNPLPFELRVEKMVCLIVHVLQYSVVFRHVHTIYSVVIQTCGYSVVFRHVHTIYSVVFRDVHAI